MNELKKEVIKISNKINQNWVEEYDESKKKGTPIDVTKIMGKYSNCIEELQLRFLESEERIKNPKKGFFN